MFNQSSRTNTVKKFILRRRNTRNTTEANKSSNVSSSGSKYCLPDIKNLSGKRKWGSFSMKQNVVSKRQLLSIIPDNFKTEAR